MSFRAPPGATSFGGVSLSPSDAAPNGAAKVPRPISSHGLRRGPQDVAANAAWGLRSRLGYGLWADGLSCDGSPHWGRIADIALAGAA